MKDVRSGIDTFIANFSAYSSLFVGKKAGLITNYTGITCNFERTSDILFKLGCLKMLFSPEHGLYGAEQAGDIVSSTIDLQLNIPVISLYGQSKKIANEYLEDIEVLAFDIQDAGLRFYTYIYTLAYGMEAAAKKRIPFVVFDRPNPLGGKIVSGNQIKKNYASFVGNFELPQRYGLTIGELAEYINVYNNLDCDLHVIPLTGWERSLWYEDISLPWVLPSPNIPTTQSLFAYMGTCFFEGTNVSEGRGTTRPMEFIGAPWIDSLLVTKHITDVLEQEHINGVHIRAHYFIPSQSKYAHTLCCGFQIHIDENQKKTIDMLKVAVLLLDTIRNDYPLHFQFLETTETTETTDKMFIDKLSGSDTLRTGSAKQYLQEMTDGTKNFINTIKNIKNSQGNSIFKYGAWQ